MKMCAICGESVGVDVQTCPRDGEASWLASVEMAQAVPALEEVAVEKRAPGRPKKTS